MYIYHFHAFYYLKILPTARQRFVFVNPNFIRGEFTPSDDEVPKYAKDIATFVKSTPMKAIGISLFGYIADTLSHAILLVFDPSARRLEIYDPNGSAASYDLPKPYNIEDRTEDADENVENDVESVIEREIDVEDENDNEDENDSEDEIEDEFRNETPTLYTPTLYVLQTLRQHGNDLFNSDGVQRVCKLWASAFVYQEGKTCASWASVIAVCRMSGIDRDRLPTKNKDMFDISSSIRSIMWNACKFSEFEEGILSFKKVDHALKSCIVPREEKEHLLHLVNKHTTKSPIPIPPDDDLCLEDPTEVQSGYSHLTINVNEVDVTDQFCKYIQRLCPDLNLITCILPDIPTYSDAISKIVDIMPESSTLELEVPNPVEINSEATMSVLVQLSESLVNVRSKEAIVRKKEPVDIPPSIYFDTILVVPETLSKAFLRELKSKADKIVFERQDS